MSGDEDKTREQRAKETLEGRISLLKNQLRDRLKTGALNIAPEEAAKLLSSTDGTVTQEFGIYASEAGKTLLGAECILAVLGSKENATWKATTLSTLKNQIGKDDKFFAEWPDEALLKFPSRLTTVVLPFAKGQLIPPRNAIAVLEAVKKAKPGLAYSPPIDELIAELKKK